MILQHVGGEHDGTTIRRGPPKCHDMGRLLCGSNHQVVDLRTRHREGLGQPLCQRALGLACGKSLVDGILERCRASTRSAPSALLELVGRGRRNNDHALPTNLVTRGNLGGKRHGLVTHDLLVKLGELAHQGNATTRHNLGHARERGGHATRRLVAHDGPRHLGKLAETRNLRGVPAR